MRQLLFTGFNAFGQVGSTVSSKETTYKVIDAADVLAGVDDDFDADKLVVAHSWRYTAYAYGKQLCLRGLLSQTVHEHHTVQATLVIKALAACENYCLVLLDDGTLHKLLPRLGAALTPIKLEAAAPALPRKRTVFGALKPEAALEITHIACGAHIAAAASSTNAIYSIPSLLQQLPGRTRVAQLVCGFEHALMLSTNGDVYSWGNGLRGQLGQPVIRAEETPTLIDALAGVKITDIAAGGWHSAAISAFGDLYTWGFNQSGQLGVRVYKLPAEPMLKEPTVYPLPQVLDLPACCTSNDSDYSCTALRAFAGARHTLLQRSCGRMWAVGWAEHGQLGLSIAVTQACYDSFQHVYVPRVADVICGPWSTLLKLYKD